MRTIRPQASQDYFLFAHTMPAHTPYFLDGLVKQSLDDQGVLFGKIVVVPRDKNPVVRDRRKLLLADLTVLFDHQFDPEVDPQDTFNVIHDRMRRARLDGIACFAMEVALFRTGEIRIWFDLRHFLGREIHAQAIPPSPEELSLAERLPPQAYFFVKDITHFHYHHEPDSDQLLPLTRLKAVTAPADHEANELSWRRETLWGLARVVSQFRRRNTLYDFKKVQGVLAYADAFQSTLAMIWRKPDLSLAMEPHTRLSRYDFAHTRASVEAMESLAVWKKSGFLQGFAIMVGVVFSSLALWAGAIQIRPIVCPPPDLRHAANKACTAFPHPNAVEAVVWVAGHPVVFTSLIFFLGFAAFILVFRDVNFIPFGTPLQRALRRVSKGAGTTASRIIRRDSALADWVGYLSSLAVISMTLGGAIYSAAHADTISRWLVSLAHLLLGQ